MSREQVDTVQELKILKCEVLIKITGTLSHYRSEKIAEKLESVSPRYHNYPTLRDIESLTV